MFSSQVDSKGGIQPILSKVDNVPVSASEKLVDEEIKKLNENSEAIVKLKEEITKKIVK